MALKFGVHAGLQKTTTDELRAVWRRVEDAGFDWISVWDHFYAADASGSAVCLEAVTTHAALALETSRVLCGSLVYSVGFRHPAVLAKVAATLDQLSGGRVVLGLGAGWHEHEYAAYGLPFPPAPIRLRQLDEGIQCVRGLLTEESTTFDGEYFQLHEAKCEPKPVQARLPLWIGGGGEKVTLRTAARHADGWNVPFLAPDVYARKVRVLHEHCEREGRDPSTITKAVNVGLAADADDLAAQFSTMAKWVSPGVLMGRGQEVVDRVQEYTDAGAEWVILAVRAPFDIDGLERFAAEVIPRVPLSAYPLMVPPAPEFRFDPLAREWVAIVDHRQSRPNLPDDGCPFCVGGSEAVTPYVVKAFTNRWPPWSPGDPIAFDDNGPHALPARGAAEVVLYSPDHDASLASIGVDGARRVVDLWADRTTELMRRPEIASVLVFENRGTAVGATIPHPHGQIYGFPFVPPVERREAEVAAAHGCPLCTAVPTEAADGERVVTSHDGWLGWVPFASGYPFGVLLAPERHTAGLPELDGASRDALAATLVDVLGRYDALFDGPMPYLLWIHQGVHVHVHLAPPLRDAATMRYIAAGEVGSGTLSNPVRPERAAEALRNVAPHRRS